MGSNYSLLNDSSIDESNKKDSAENFNTSVQKKGFVTIPEEKLAVNDEKGDGDDSSSA